ncbi:MAG TPA: bifunctional riboflavin kinase/FAD synthetase [Sandaracinaceae bacterium LLY-WYZ-13_1]|nr:bifunctional riboflavin kinase/FAD synthetase [Sandaracinaceae bacterium LLY-WYZ-13_1]
MSESPAPATVVTPGNHDGVHLGHRALLDAARERAAPDGLTVTVLTFDPHPARVLAPDRAPPLLTTLERRMRLLRDLGADRVEVLRFDRARAGQAPEDFVREVLVDRLRARGLVVGPDFRFGRGAKGDAQTLRRMGGELGFDVREVGPVRLGGETVSSTRIRAALRDGDVAAASRLLGRLHDVDGTVVEGDRRGRTIGFPTANLDCAPVLLPSDGVYAVVARPLDGGELLRGVANLGVRPTVEAGRSVEAHFFDFGGDLYGQRLRLGFVARLRGEQKFDGLEALKAQIDADARGARAALDEADPERWAWI